METELVPVADHTTFCIVEIAKLQDKILFALNLTPSILVLNAIVVLSLTSTIFVKVLLLLIAQIFKIVLNVTQPNVQNANKGINKSLIQNNAFCRQQIVLWVAPYALQINVSNVREDIQLNHGQSA